MSDGYQFIECMMHRKMLNVERFQTDPGTPIILWDKEEGPPKNELFRLEPVYGNMSRFYIVPALRPDMVLDVEGYAGDEKGPPTGGRRIVINPRKPKSQAYSQSFHWIGELICTGLEGEFVLDVENYDGRNGARLVLMSRIVGGDNSSQRWKLSN